jgi:alkanesulfonate monooxygenase SsuD/methylene tetrahydromethanopterin reductase-like flavin-dependent oxidoreductase (luciferase family)
MAERHARLEHTLDVLDEMWDANRDERFSTFPMPCVRPKIVLGVNSIALAKVAGRRTDGVNVRASHPYRQEILEAARPTDSREYVMSVWDFLDESVSLATRGDDLRAVGVNRIIGLVRGKIDPRRVASFGK